MFGECLDMGVKFERSDAEFWFNNFSPHFPRALPAGQPKGTMFSLILWMLAHSTLSDVPFPLPNASLVNLHQPDARVSGFLVVKSFNSPMLEQGIRKVLADAVEMAEAAFNVAIVYPGGTGTTQFKYSLTFSGDSPDTNSTEQALIASERLSQLNASSVTTRVTELWPQLCQNESWCISCAWTLTWMSQPELSLWSSLTTLATTKSQGCEQRDGPVRVSGSRVFSVNDIVMNSSIEEIDEWRDNVSREMGTWWKTLKTAIPTCSWLGGQLYKDLSVHKRCWNPAAGRGHGGSWWDSETWSHCQPHNCSLSCEFKIDAQMELCGQSSGAEIRDALDSLPAQYEYARIFPSVRSEEIKYCEYEHVIEVTPGVNFFGTFAHLFDPDASLFRPREVGLGPTSNIFQKGLVWKHIEICNSSGLFYFIRLRAFESALAGQKESWVNFTTILFNYDFPPKPTWTGASWTRVQIQWRIKVSSPKSLSTPWLAPEIHLPCLVEFQEHLLKVNFLPNGSGHHHPLRGSRFNAPLDFAGSWGWRGELSENSLWAQPGSSGYEMTSEDLRAWRLRHNKSKWSRPSGILEKIAVGPAPNSLEITLVPPAGGPNTKWRVCFIPADGFHIYPEVCTEQFPVRENAEGCQKMESTESSKGVQMTAAACLTSLWFALTWF